MVYTYLSHYGKIETVVFHWLLSVFSPFFFSLLFSLFYSRDWTQHFVFQFYRYVTLYYTALVCTGQHNFDFIFIFFTCSLLPSESQWRFIQFNSSQWSNLQINKDNFNEQTLLKMSAFEVSVWENNYITLTLTNQRSVWMMWSRLQKQRNLDYSMDFAFAFSHYQNRLFCSASRSIGDPGMAPFPSFN